MQILRFGQNKREKIKWLIKPTVFLTGILKKPFSTRLARLTGAIRGFCGSSTFGGGADSKW